MNVISIDTRKFTSQIRSVLILVFYLTLKLINSFILKKDYPYKKGSL